MLHDVLFGYRVDEQVVFMKKLPKLGKGCKVSLKYVKFGRRRIMQRALGAWIVGQAPPMPDVDHWFTMMFGAIYRYAREVPAADLGLLRRWAKWQRVFLHRHCRPLERVMSFDEWLETTTYPATRKASLRELYLRLGGYDGIPLASLLLAAFPRWSRELSKAIKHYDRLFDFSSVSGFGKVESYVNDDFIFKMARGINPRGDLFMVLFGPLVKSVELAIFHPDESIPNHISKYFIKAIPVSQRGQYLHDRLYRAGGNNAKTDHTSFEAHMVPAVWNNSERVLYEFMWRDCVPILYRRLFYAVMTGENRIKYKNGLVVTVMGRRMSGDPNTSLGNGYINLVSGLFNGVMNGADMDDLDCICEGDDGCFVWTKVGPSEDNFKRLGFEVKFELVPSLADVGFCHIYFDETDPSVALTDVRKQLLSFGWTHSKFLLSQQPRVLKGLLRAKAMSLLCEFPQCPVLSKLGRKILLLTGDTTPVVDADIRNRQERMGYNINDVFESSMINVISSKSRLFVQKQFNLSVEWQLEVEKAIDAMESWNEPLKITVPGETSVWSMYYDLYYNSRSLSDVGG